MRVYRNGRPAISFGEELCAVTVPRRDGHQTVVQLSGRLDDGGSGDARRAQNADPQGHDDNVEHTPRRNATLARTSASGPSWATTPSGSAVKMVSCSMTYQPS